MKIIEFEQQKESHELFYPLVEYYKLSKACQKIVDESQTDPSKLLFVGKSLIEGTNEFPKNIKLGIQCIEESIKQNNIEAILYYSSILMKGDIIKCDLQKSNEYLSKIDPNQDSRVYVLKGKISYKMSKFKESVHYFEEGSKSGDKESMYQYAKMLFIGEGIKKNVSESIKYNKSIE